MIRRGIAGGGQRIRIPTSKIYRAFPELDRFSDAECRAFMARLRRGIGVQVVEFVVTAVLGLGVFAGTVLVQTRLPDPTERGWFGLSGDDVYLLWAAIYIGMPFLTSLMTILIVRDAFVRRALRTRILNVVRRFTCRGCAYSLVGLRANERIVRCPECGHETTFTELGIADDGELQLNADASPSAAP